ncbi:hypothetical protein EDB89DRAFT_1555694 [Lactarius sanguifluus]|nr:hypothetical protein EDB89DRAFT_1555694 [Lactarius sanguifluus]
MKSQCENHGHATTIDTLTDNVLLEIFDLIRTSRPAYEVRFYPVWKWRPLVRVCHRWREIIFASPLRLDLQLLCTHGKPQSVWDYLKRWPPTFPVAVDYGHTSGKNPTPEDEDNIFTTLELREIRERIRLFRLSITDGVLAEVIALMRKPFPELRHLAISSYPGRDTRGQNGPALPRNFLGGSAPSLREISFNGIRFPALPTLLSSTSDLVKLSVINIPKTAYFPPAAFAACLAVLPRLEDLSIGFRSQPSRTNETHLPPTTRAVLPSLTSFTFVGDSAYLEVVVPLVDTPQLYSIDITYTDQQDIQVTELYKLIVRSGIKPSGLGHAEISFVHDSIAFYSFLETDPEEPTIAIQVLSDEEIDELVGVMALVLNQTSAMLSDVVRLEVTFDRDWQLADDDTVNDIEWLELFRPFTAVEKLRIYEKLAESINDALEDQTEEIGAQVLPALKSISQDDQRPARDMKALIDDLLDRSRLLSSGGEGLDSDDSE